MPIGFSPLKLDAREAVRKDDDSVILVDHFRDADLFRMGRKEFMLDVGVGTKNLPECSTDHFHRCANSIQE